MKKVIIALAVLVIICLAVSYFARPYWVLFIMRLPIPGWLKMWLWGWV